MGALGDLDAVEHHHRQAHVLKAARHEIRERGAGALDEHLRDRRLRRRGGGLLGLGADGLTDLLEAARGDAGEHPVHHRPRQRVAVGEVVVGRERQLVLIVHRAHPRPLDLHAPSSQGHRSVPVAVALCGPIRVPLALWSDDLIDLELHQLMHDPEAYTDAERWRGRLGAPTSSPNASWICAGSGLSLASKAVTTFGADTFFMAVPPVLADLVGACHARNASGRGGRTAIQSSTRSRTTSSSSATQVSLNSDLSTKNNTSAWGVSWYCCLLAIYFFVLNLHFDICIRAVKWLPRPAGRARLCRIAGCTRSGWNHWPGRRLFSGAARAQSRWTQRSLDGLGIAAADVLLVWL